MQDEPYRLIPLHRKDRTVAAHAIVDACDFDRLGHLAWSLDNDGYVRRKKPGGRNVKLHREILGVTDPKIEVEHENGNPLDCRRANLRPATRSQNMQNRIGLATNNTSGYRGVCWKAKERKWMAQAVLNGGNHYLGYYATAEEADAVVKAWRAANMPFSEDARAT
jgi:hypothetical protein